MLASIKTVQVENRHELILTGDEIIEDINQHGLRRELFETISLNYLNISATNLTQLPDEIARLSNLQALVLHRNKLATITPRIGALSNLKLLDLSWNCLCHLPGEIVTLQNLTSLNLSSNKLETIPPIMNMTKLQVLDLSSNNLKVFPDVCNANLVNLQDLLLEANKIEGIPEEIKDLPALKCLNLARNKIGVLPGELVLCGKLKEFNAKDNPIKDRRLFKLVNNAGSRTKQIMDYIKQHSKIDKSSKDKRKDDTKTRNKEEEEETESKCDMRAINVTNLYDASTLKIVVGTDVKEVRPFILGCVLHRISFDNNMDKFKRFIQMQTRLHESLCEKRKLATIAAHDVKKISGDIYYTTRTPDQLHIQPMNRSKKCTAKDLFAQLRSEAEQLRKDHKRNTYVGVHKFLHLLDGQQRYPCTMDSNGEVISLPPITNSDVTKISLETEKILFEVTSSTSLNICQRVLDALLEASLEIFEGDLNVEQISCVDESGVFKNLYPSRTDLEFAIAMANLKVNR